MKHDALVMVIDGISKALENAGVAFIAAAFAYAAVRGLREWGLRREAVYTRVRHSMGRSLLLGLEFLVAADVIRTVTIEFTMDGILMLGLLIAIRTVLSWTVMLEIEGCWPWQVAARRAVPDRGNGSGRDPGSGTGQRGA